MSLVRLLATGKSLVGLNDSTCRYQMRSRSLLPKFGAENPFLSKAQPEPPDESATANVMKDTAQVVGPCGQPVAVSSEGKTQRFGSPQQRTAQEAETPRATSQVGTSKPNGGWLRILLHFPFSSFKRNPSRPPFIPRFHKTAVRSSTPFQAELSLENIKVVRNDLTEADVEIVSRKSPLAAPAAKPASQGVEQRFAAELAGGAWGRTVARVLSKT